MQTQGTRMYRVRAVAEMFDVSVSTIYRAIESGQLHALKIGTGKGSLRIPDYAIEAFREACATVAASESALTPAQADGRACVVCSADFLTVQAPHRPVGRSQTGSQVFACSAHADQAAGQYGRVA